MAKKKQTANGKGPYPPRPGPEQMYVDGTPVDEHGNPIEDIEVSEDVGRGLPLDPESSRIRQQSNLAMKKKMAGGKAVRLSSDHRVRFQEAKRLYPSSYVTFKKLEPEEDDGIPQRQVALFQNYDGMVKYLRDSYWDGRQSTYQWTIRDAAYLPWATGLVKFAERSAVQPEEEEDDMARRGQPQGYPPGYYPNPYPQQLPPGYYYPPQQQPQAPIPEGFTLSPAQLMQMSMAGQQAGVPPEILGQFLQMFERLSQNNATLTEQLRQRAAPQQPTPMPYAPPPDQSQVFMPYLMQMMEMVMKGKDPTVVPPPAPPPPPVDPIQQVKNGFEVLTSLTRMQRQIAREFAPAQPQLQENPVADSPDDELPFILKDMGPIRAVLNKDGTPVDLLTKTVFNMDKIGSLIESVADRFQARKRQHEQEQQQQPQVVDTTLAVQERKVALLREAREHSERLQELAARPQPQPQLNPQFVRAYEPPPEPPPPPPPAAPPVLPLALRMMRRAAPPPIELVPEAGDEEPEVIYPDVPRGPSVDLDLGPPETPAEESTADTEPPPPPIVQEAN